MDSVQVREMKMLNDREGIALSLCFIGSALLVGFRATDNANAGVRK
jgi:hypothetical protein